jgi:membrane glycosyltransferase
MTLLNDPLALSRLHFQVWVAPEAAPVWANAGAPS